MRKYHPANSVTLLILWIALLSAVTDGCSSSSEATKDCYSVEQFKKYSLPSVSPYFLNVKTKDGSRVDVYIQMSFQHLHFVKQPSGYQASYGLSYIVRGDKNEIIHARDVDRTIETQTYEESVSNRFDGTMQSFSLPPGKYSFEIIAADGVSRLEYHSINEVAVKDYHFSHLSASGELFLDTVTYDSKGILLKPVVPSNVSLLSHSLGIFQELYNVHKGDTIRVSQAYSAAGHSPGTEEEFNFSSPPYKTNQQFCIAKDDTEYFRQDSIVLSGQTGTAQLIQFYPLPGFGRSLVKRQIVRGSDTVRSSQVIFRHRLGSGGAPPLDELTDAMRYIMREEEYDSLVSGGKGKLILSLSSFWENRGGRERFRDFQNKVLDADNLFSSCVEGSRTPMGISYIVCGAPDYVDCRGEFFENWYYAIGERSYALQFRQTGNDDRTPNYELVPFSVNEMMWQYFVDRWRSRK